MVIKNFYIVLFTLNICCAYEIQCSEKTTKPLNPHAPEFKPKSSCRTTINPQSNQETDTNRTSKQPTNHSFTVTAGSPKEHTHPVYNHYQ